MTGQAVRTEIKFDVPANGTAQWSGDWSVVRCLEASSAFQLQIDDGIPLTMERGLGHRFESARFSRVTVIAPDAQSVQGTLICGDGAIEDSRVSISAESGLTVNVARLFGAPLKVAAGTVPSGRGNTTPIFTALDTKIEWVVIQNRGATDIGVSSAAGAISGAIILSPGERLELRTAGPLHVTNMSASYAGRYAVIYGERAGA